MKDAAMGKQAFSRLFYFPFILIFIAGWISCSNAPTHMVYHTVVLPNEAPQEVLYKRVVIRPDFRRACFELLKTHGVKGVQSANHVSATVIADGHDLLVHVQFPISEIGPNVNLNDLFKKVLSTSSTARCETEESGD